MARQRTDSTQVIGAVRELNRLELAGESVRAALEALAVAAPGLAAHRDRRRRWGTPLRGPGRHLAAADLEDQARRARTAYGRDAVALLRAVYATPARPGPRPGASCPRCEVLRRVLVQNYVIPHQRRGAGGGQGAGGRHRWSPARQSAGVLAV